MNVILSSNYDRTYFEFIPMVVRIWNKLLPEANIHLLLVDKHRWDKRYIETIENLPKINVHYTESRNLYSGRIAKISRLAKAVSLDEFSIIHDIDSAPLSKDYIDYVYSNYRNGKVTCIGFEVYEHITDEKGKFPMGWLSGKGEDFKNMLGLSSRDFSEVMDELIEKSIKSTDSPWPYTNINNKKDSIEGFSDESLLAYLVYKFGSDKYQNKITRNPNPTAPIHIWAPKHCMPRSKPDLWKLNNITSETYEANLIRPLGPNLKFNAIILIYIFKKYSFEANEIGLFPYDVM
mgnify:CR=1 FL=1